MEKAMSNAVIFALGAATLLAGAGAFALDPPKPGAADKTTTTSAIVPANSRQLRVLGWDDLLPPEERNQPYVPPQSSRPLFDDESGPAASQEGSTAVNKSLDGERVKLPGFIVPLTVDKNLRTSDFLLVPYFGACVHVPPPAPNQIVHVVMDKPLPLKSMYDPVWVIGKLSVRGAATELATAAYSLAGSAVDIYEEEP